MTGPVSVNPLVSKTRQVIITEWDLFVICAWAVEGLETELDHPKPEVWTKIYQALCLVNKDVAQDFAVTFRDQLPEEFQA